jgi:phospholipase C
MGEEQVASSAGTRPNRWRLRRTSAVVASSALVAAGLATFALTSASAGVTSKNVKNLPHGGVVFKLSHSKTKIKHVVVIFDENVSFDHYFGTYPNATNSDGTPFTAKPNTPAVDGLTPALLNNNPNAFPPLRLTHSEALTCDQNHSYGPEQKADDNGAMDKFEQNTGHDTCTGQPILFGSPGLVMDYYDGNTVTALWNYAQNYSMSDNYYNTAYGPSTPGALNLISGDTGGGYAVPPTTVSPTPADAVADPGSVGSVNPSTHLGTVFGDIDPFYDQCADNSHTATNPLGVVTGKNIGDLLNAKGVTWGWFQGGFAPTGTSGGFAVCGASHTNIGGIPVTDYVPHHEPFQYYKSTANPTHAPPSSEAMVGKTDQANHQYDLSWFYKTLQDGNMPAVSFLKPPAYQNGHAANSDPLDEQTFLVNTINQIEQSKDWSTTAIVITYDDSDGWYDHQAPPTISGSNDPANDSAPCNTVTAWISFGEGDRCGYGPRLPLVVVSPYAPDNYVSHNLTDQTSVIKFIEQNWLRGAEIGDGSYDTIAGSLDAPGGVLDFSEPAHKTPLILDPTTGAVVPPAKHHR